MDRVSTRKHFPRCNTLACRTPSVAHHQANEAHVPCASSASCLSRQPTVSHCVATGRTRRVSARRDAMGGAAFEHTGSFTATHVGNASFTKNAKPRGLSQPNHVSAHDHVVSMLMYPTCCHVLNYNDTCRFTMIPHRMRQQRQRLWHPVIRRSWCDLLSLRLAACCVLLAAAAVAAAAAAAAVLRICVLVTTICRIAGISVQKSTSPTTRLPSVDGRPPARSYC